MAVTPWQERFTPELIEQYWRDGVVHLPQLIEQAWLDLIELGIRRIVNGPGGKSVFFAGDPGAFIDTTRNFDQTPEFQRLLYDSAIADMMSVLLGSERVWLLFDHVFVKDGGETRAATRRTPWHQDLPYWPVAGRQLASMWISIDPLPKAECLEYVRGSHDQITYDGFDPSRVNESPTLPYYGAEYPRLPDIDADRDNWDIVSWDITPGDVILAHPNVLHGGGHTTAGTSRRALAVRIFGEDVVFADRPKTRRTAPHTPGLELTLKPGDPLRHPYYPRLRPLPAHQRADYFE
jgi:hypothetical protein